MPSFPSPRAFFASLFSARLHMEPGSGYSKAKWSTLKYVPRITGNAVIRFLISFGSTVFPYRAGLRCLCSLWTVSSLGTETSSRTSLRGCLREIIFTLNTASQKRNPFPTCHQKLSGVLKTSPWSSLTRGGIKSFRF